MQNFQVPGKHTFFTVFPVWDYWQTSGWSLLLHHQQFENAIIFICRIYNISVEIALFTHYNSLESPWQLWSSLVCSFSPQSQWCITISPSVLQSLKAIWASVCCCICAHKHSCVCCLRKYKVLVVWNKSQEKTFQVMWLLCIYLVFKGPARMFIRMPLPCFNPLALSQ